MSVYFNILTAVNTLTSTVVANSVIRKNLHKLESDSLPLLIVAPGEQGERVTSLQFGGGAWWSYPVLVAYIRAGNRDVTVGLSSLLDTREQLRDLLYSTILAGIGSVFDVDMSPMAVSRFAEYVGSNYDVTGFEVSYKSAEVQDFA